MYAVNLHIKTGGSVFRLAKPGTDMGNEMLEGAALYRLLDGDVLKESHRRLRGFPPAYPNAMR